MVLPQPNRLQPSVRRPWHPVLVLAAGILLPGAGQVVNGQPTRGLIMLFYIILLGIVTSHFADADQSLLARYAGGWFVYFVSFMDAYRVARYRWEYYRRDAAASARHDA